MTLKTDLQAKSAQIDGLRDSIAADASTLVTRISELDALIDDVGEPEVPEPLVPVIRTGFATSFATPFYPHSIRFYEGYIYLTTVGGRPITPYTTENSKLNKINPATGLVVASYSAGPYGWGTPGNGGTGGMNGFDIYEGVAYCANNRYGFGDCEMIAVNLSDMSEIARVSLGAGICRHAVFINGKVWATVDGQHKVKRIDPSTWTVDLDISTHNKPFRMIAADGSLWIACFDADSVRRINPDTGATITTITTGDQPNWFDVDPDTGLIYIACYTGNIIQVINPATNGISTLATLSSDFPHHAMPLYNELWVACSGSAKIKIFDKVTGTLKQTKTVGPNPPSLCFDGSSVWHGCGNNETLQRHLAEIFYA